MNAHPFSEGLLWQATRGDTTIHLFGTFHLYDDVAAGFMKRLMPLIKKADAAFVEGNRADLAKLKKMVTSATGLLFRTAGPTLPEALTEEEWQLLSAALKERGTPPFLARKMATWMVSAQLSIPACAIKMSRDGLEGIDFLIIDAATDLGVDTHSLEPFDTLIRVFSATAPEEELQVIRMALANLRYGTDGFITMRNQYRHQRVSEIWEFSKLLAFNSMTISWAGLDAIFAETEELLVHSRNQNWMNELLPKAEGKTVLVAAGALHLPGEKGLLTLLKTQGFQIKRLELATE